MRSLDVMLSRAGVYVVIAPTNVGLVEVDPDGRCYQLELESGHARVMELKPGGWCVGNIRAILGPFERIN